MNNKIIIIGGDPNSINSEIIYKTWIKIDKKIRKNLYLVANYELLKKQYKILNYKIKLQKIDDVDEKVITDNLKVLNISLNFDNPFKVSSSNSFAYIQRSLNFAHDLSIKKKVKGIINCPINKKLISRNGNIGVTEFLARKCKIKAKNEVMMIYNEKLSVVPLTTHLSLKNVSKNISKNLINKKIITLYKYFKILFKKKPIIGILGLNPHNGELTKNSEEFKQIIPAIKNLNKKKIKVYGPLVSDTIFINNYKKYDVIVGMYHDQVLSPFKTLFHFNAINITLGLNYLRISPDHGPANDLIGKNKADYTSLLKCVRFMNKLI